MSYEAVVLADGPIGYWRLGEATGAVALPTAGTVAGTYVGGYTLGAPGALTGDSDTAVSMNGASGSVAFGDAFDFPGDVPYSIEVWVRPTVIDSDYRRIVSKETLMTPLARQGYTLILQSGGLGFERWRDGSANATTTSPLLVLVYSHVVGTYANNTLSLYVNGVLADSSPTDLILADIDFPLTLAASSAGTNAFAGSVDELAIYDKALTSDRVLAHYNAGQGLFP